MSTIAIIAAAGLGKRFGEKKTFASLRGMPVLYWTLRAFARSPLVDGVMAVVRAEDMDGTRRIIGEAGFGKSMRVVEGGVQRQDSVYNALRAIAGEAHVVLVHDGARPLVADEVIKRTIDGLAGADGAIAAVPPKDTIKEVKQADADMIVSGTLDRSRLWSVQTPQAFGFDTLMRAYDAAMREGHYATDDAALVERAGGRVRIVMGDYRNIKVTTPEDIAIAETLLSGMEVIES